MAEGKETADSAKERRLPPKAEAANRTVRGRRGLRNVAENRMDGSGQLIRDGVGKQMIPDIPAARQKGCLPRRKNCTTNHAGM